MASSFHHQLLSILFHRNYTTDSFSLLNCFAFIKLARRTIPIADESQNKIYRVIDANFNRATEGLRTAEEFARFVSENEELARDLKLLRHDLASVIGQVDRLCLLENRDTKGDVGTVIQIASEYQRSNTVAILSAAAQRVQQSMRCLEEYLKLIHPELSFAIEPIRYRAYDLLAAIEIMARKNETSDLSIFLDQARLYLLVDCQLSIEDFAKRVQQLSLAGVDLIQVRDKSLDARQLISYIRQAMEVVDPSVTRIVVNDRVDVALITGADLVHVGQEDVVIESIRQLSSKVGVGVSTHNLQQAKEAVLAKADYIGCGPTFSSLTKSFEQFAGPAFLEQVAAEITVPAFAIGGITLERLDEVLETGIKRVAVSAAIWRASDPPSAAKAFVDRLGAA